MSTQLDWIDEELRTWDALGLRRHRVAREGRQGVEIVMEGRRLVNFGSNDYLGLAGEVLSEPVVDAVRRLGWGSGASPLITGRGSLHAALEESLAAFEGTPAALLFPSGFAANCGAVTTLVGKGDVVLSDAHNHASIIDGCRLSGARIVVYPHRDMAYLEMMLQQAKAFRRRLVITDGLFSMDGSFAPLVELTDIARRYDAMVLVDEAHATGVIGARGRGVAEQLGIEDGVHVRVGTLSKALGSVGGFVAGPQRLVEWLWNKARTYVFSTMPPEAVAAAAMRALEIVRSEPQRRDALLAAAAQLRQRLRRDGWNTGDSVSQIIPLFVGAPGETMRLAAALQQRGFYVPGIRPPTVPEGQSLLRISVTSAHTPRMLDQLCQALSEII
jgi:8-amino-7-oxononanoate synthase